MRVNPAVIFFNPANTNAQVRNISASNDLTGTTVNGTAGTEAFVIGFTGLAGTAVGDALGVNVTVDSSI
jgi:ADP-ribosylglycohydrolase